MTIFIATLRCPDEAGIIHAVTGALLEVNANILEQAQFTDDTTAHFCMRTRFETENTDIEHIKNVVTKATNAVSPGSEITIRNEETHRRILIMVSQYDHCLADLLYRWQMGDLPVEIVGVVSNHTTAKELVERYGVPFHHIPVTPETKHAAEAQLTELISTHHVDAIILARYMQILSEAFCDQYPGRIINIHHSFLPGFKGARPYHQAHERGVKLIGATAHFVTADLDEGPIIEQEVERVNHAQSADDLASIGRDIERIVLSRAVKLYAEDRIQLIGKHTVVFA